MPQPTTPSPRTVSCPQCGQAVIWGPTSPYRPFCSERCKLIDAGAWASGQYAIPEETEDVSSETDQDEN